MAPRKRLALVGNGMTAARLLDELLAREGGRRFDITVFGEERGGSYNRILLGKVLAGASAQAIETKPASWYHERGVHLEAGVRVGRLDLASRSVETIEGRRHPFDLAVLATGSDALLPQLEGLPATPGTPWPEGLHVYRTTVDAMRIRAALDRSQRVVVVGGGLLGLEAAYVLRQQGADVTVLHRSSVLMNTQLDEPASLLLRAQVEGLGIGIEIGAASGLEVRQGRVFALRLEEGRTLPADLVVFAVGVRPRVEVAQASGLDVRRGVLVDDGLSTSSADVFAIGECAEHRGRTYGLVAPCWEQAQVLAKRLSGEAPELTYEGSRVYSRLKVAGVDVASMGLVHPESLDDEVVQVFERRRGVYRKLIVRDGRLVGAIMVGDPAAAATAVRAFDRGTPLPENVLDLFCSPAAYARMADTGREVCNCEHVDETTIRRAIGNGCDTVEALSSCTRAGTGCGSCRPELARLISVGRKDKSVAA